jgi:SAM-dependent methyltransferase
MDRRAAGHLRSQVREAYSAAAEVPDAKHPFPVGRRFAESLGYPPELIDDLPRECVDAFAGVTNISVTADLSPGKMVLDLGCGAGLDSLIAARRIGPGGTIVGVDFSESMLSRARRAATQSGLSNILFCRADGERLPFRDQQFELAMVNGIFNLNPARKAIFSELARVLRPSGVLFASELILSEPLPKRERASADNWFA